MEICMELDYIRGNIIDGHFEGEVYFSREEEKDFQALLRKDLNDEELSEEEIDRLEKYKEKIINNCELVIDWYDIIDTSGYHWKDCLD